MVVSGHGTTSQPPGPAICYHTLWRARRLRFPVPEVQRRSPPESGQRYDAAFFEGEMWMVSLKQPPSSAWPDSLETQPSTGN
jgi:hypothetical protein